MWTYNYNDELYHHGIKGQKWGVRRFQNKNGTLTSAGRKRYDEAKKNYKDAKREYSKSFNRAYNYTNSHPVANIRGKGHKAQEINRRWEDVYDKADNLVLARSAYKKEKRIRKDKIQNQTSQLYKDDKAKALILYNQATYKKAAKYIVDNDMPVEQAVRKAKSAANRNTAIWIAALAANSYTTGMKLASKYR